MENLQFLMLGKRKTGQKLSKILYHLQMKKNQETK